MKRHFLSAFFLALIPLIAFAAPRTDYEALIQNATAQNFEEVVAENPKLLKAEIGPLKENALLCAIRLDKPEEIISFLLSKKIKAAGMNGKKQDALIYISIYSADNPVVAAAVLKQYGGKKELTKALTRKDSYKKCALDYIKENANMITYELIARTVDDSVIEKYRPKSEPTVKKRLPTGSSKTEENIEPADEPDTTAETTEENTAADAGHVDTVPEITELPDNEDTAENQNEKENVSSAGQEKPQVQNTAPAEPFKKLFLYDYEPAQKELVPEPQAEKSANLASIANPNERDINGRTLLMKAVKDGNDWEVRSLIKSGADVNMADLEGWTAFMYAIRYQNSLEIVNILLDNGADPAIPNKYGTTSLQLAATYTSNPEILRVVLEKYPAGSNEIFKSFILAITANTGSTATQAAKINVFIEKNVPLNRFYEGKTPLMLAAEYSSSTQILKTLIDNGALPSIRDASGKTAFYYASMNTSLEHDDIYWSLNGH